MRQSLGERYVGMVRVRDPYTISRIDEVIAWAKAAVRERFGETCAYRKGYPCSRTDRDGVTLTRNDRRSEALWSRSRLVIPIARTTRGGDFGSPSSAEYSAPEGAAPTAVQSHRPPDLRMALRRLIREMSLANPLWGAPRLHGELLKLGIEVAQSTVAKYMARGRPPPGQSWKTFLRNHAAGIAAMDLLVVKTIGFRLLYAFVVLHHHRRRILSVAVTFHPTAEWIARQVAEAFPWQEAPRYLIRDRDAAYGLVVRRRLAAMGIRDRPIAARSPWQNAFVERLIGSIRREASTISSSSASVTSAIFSNHTPVTTTACELIFPWTRTRRSIARHTAPDRLWRSQSSAASITIMCGRDFQEAHPLIHDFTQAMYTWHRNKLRSSAILR
jgi:transposase InsO family protein